VFPPWTPFFVAQMHAPVVRAAAEPSLAKVEAAVLKGVDRFAKLITVGSVRLIALAAVALMAVHDAAARSLATADLSVKWVGVQGKPVVGTPFLLQAGVVNSGPDVGSSRINIQMPLGVRRVGGGLECSQDGQILHCDEISDPLGDDGSGTASFVADTPGDYAFVVFLDHLTAVDPNAANNMDAITATVAARPVTASAAAVRPAHPRAGTKFVVAFAVQGAPVTAARCATSVGRAVATSRGNSVTCAVTTPRAARGRTARVTVIAVAGGQTVTRKVSIRLT
jgi:hypothetical protein